MRTLEPASITLGTVDDCLLYTSFVYRFGDTILAYYWDKNITPEQQKRNAKSLKRIEDTEYLAALMGRGLALEKIAENAIDVAYLFRSAVGEASVVSSAQGELSLCFPCVPGESFFVPVKPENRPEAEEMCIRDSSTTEGKKSTTA